MSINKTEIVQKLFKLSGTGKWDEVQELLHPDFELLPAASHPYAGVYRGVAGFKALFKKVFVETYDKFEPNLLEFAEGPDRVVGIMNVTIKGKKTGNTVVMSLAEVFYFVDGKLRSITPHYLDTKLLCEL